MTEPHKRNRHPKYKTSYRVNNWAEYDKALRDRGDITLWISQDAIDAGHHHRPVSEALNLYTQTWPSKPLSR